MFNKKKKKKNVAVKKSTVSSGRTVMSYFLPALIASALLLLILLYVTGRTIDENVHSINSKVAHATANSLIQGVSEAIDSRQSLLVLLGSQDEVVRALQANDSVELRKLGDKFAAKIPEIIDLFIVSTSILEDSSQIGTRGSFAAIDLVRRVIKSGEEADVEAHQLNTTAPTTAIAVPVVQNEQVIGAIYATYSLDIFANQVSRMSSSESAFMVRQTSGGASKTLVKGKGYDEGDSTQYESIPGTLWQVGVQVTPIEGNINNLKGVILLILGTLGLILFYMQQRLDKDFKYDLDLIKELTDSVISNAGARTVTPKLKDTHDIIEGLNLLAKANYVSAKLNASGETAVKTTALAEIDAESQMLAAVEAPIRVGELPESIFRAYDIRGVVDKTLTTDIAQLLGQALGSMALEQGEKALIIGRDVRLSSQGLAEGLSAGILATGCDVIDLGEVPTPMMYFATHVLHSHSGIMVTGSHNPPEYNGFKIVMGGQALAEQALQNLREQMLIGDFKSGVGKMAQKHHLSMDYISRVTEDVQLAEPRKVVVDGGNGVAGPLTVELLRELGCEVVELFCEPDGTFPNHHPDPGKPENLASLVLEVQAQQADLGIALDGDGDRLGVVDSSGQLVSADKLIMLLASDILQRHPGVDIVYDVKSSGHLAGHILASGGRPIMWKTGHTRIKEKMKETGALLGGEFSGHIFIKERWFGFDDAAYTAARLLEILCTDSRPVERFFADLPSSISTGEIQMNLQEGENFALMEALKREIDFDDANIIDIDGLRVEFPDGWGLVRASNTTPALVFRFEAKDRVALNEVKGRLRELTQSVAPGQKIPF